MRYCLGQHSRIYIAPETGFFFKIYGNRRLIKEANINKYADLIIERMFRLSGDPSLREFEGLKTKLVHAISEHARSYADVARIIFTIFASSKGKSRWGEKTPIHLFHLERIFELFPDAKIINLIREPKSMVASFVASKHTPDDFITALAYYQLCLKAGQANAKRLMTVRYEDLTDQPEETLKKVCAYLNEEFESAMLYPGMRDSSYGTQIMEFDKSIGIMKPDKTRWAEVLPPSQVDFVDYITGDSQTKFKLIFLRYWLKLAKTELRFRISFLKSNLGYENIKKSSEFRFASAEPVSER